MHITGTADDGPVTIAITPVIVSIDNPEPRLPGAQTPSGLEQRLLSQARAAGLARGNRLVVGFSGGRDSTALAASLRRVAAVLGVEPLLVHIDHRLREASAAEARRAVELAAALGLNCQVVTLGPWPDRVMAGVGWEQAARDARYASLRTVAIENHARAVVTAHHQQDQAETVLLHLMRGAGLRGARGMTVIGPLPRPQPSGHDISHEPGEPWLWRPFLNESRAALEAYVETLGVQPIDDPSNLELTLRRNALRHDILPRLESLHPGAVTALARFATIAAEEDEFLESLAAAELASSVDPGGLLPVASVRERPPAIARRMLRAWVWQQAGPIELSSERTEALLSLAIAGHGGREIEIGQGWSVRLERGILRASHGGETGKERNE